MSAGSRAWIVAASVGVVEALKDQGFCRWTHPIRSLHQQARNRSKPISQTKKLSSSSSSSSSFPSTKQSEDNPCRSESEESLRKVMYLSCWGPY